MQPEYSARTPSDSVSPPFALAMHSLRLSNRGARHFLGDRLSLGMIKHMRHGRRRIPQWVAAILDTALAARMDELRAERQRLAAIPPREAYNGARHLRAWQRNRALQKEKAGS